MNVSVFKEAKPNLILPHGAQISRDTPCLFGVSVSDHPLSIERNLAALAWVESHFSNYACLVGDSLYRMTLRIRHDWTEEKAGAAAIEAGTDYLTRMTKEMLVVPKIIRTSRVLHSQHFEQAAVLIRDAFNRNHQFQTSVTQDARAYCERQSRNQRVKVSLENALQISVEYLLEELAIYHLLAEQGWLIDVYPGSGLSTLSKFIIGDLPGISAALERRIFIELKIKNEASL